MYFSDKACLNIRVGGTEAENFRLRPLMRLDPGKRLFVPRGKTAAGAPAEGLHAHACLRP